MRADVEGRRVQPAVDGVAACGVDRAVEDEQPVLHQERHDLADQHRRAGGVAVVAGQAGAVGVDAGWQGLVPGRLDEHRRTRPARIAKRGECDAAAGVLVRQPRQPVIGRFEQHQVEVRGDRAGEDRPAVEVPAHGAPQPVRHHRARQMLHCQATSPGGGGEQHGGAVEAWRQHQEVGYPGGDGHG